jgi:low temperature requirement protein LtrA
VKGIEIPEKTEDFTADPVELFFDLAFVFAFSQLVGRLIYDADWTGVGKTALLFWLIWLPWSQFTWAANAVSGNGRAVRVFFLVATAACMPMAASISTAFDDGGPAFALSICVIMAMGIATMFLGVAHDPAIRRAIYLWGTPIVVSMVVLVVGAFLDGSARIVAWCAMALIVMVAMGSAGRGEWLIRGGHFAERHGLILIIALGEIIVAIGLPVVVDLEEGDGLAVRTIISLIAAGAFAGLMWWAYFDRVSPALEHRAEGIDGDRQRGRYARDVYTGAHSVIVAGVVLSAAALEEITIHPSDEILDSFRMMLVGGIGMTLLGVVVAVWRAFGVIARERLVAIAVIAVIVAMTGSVSGLVVLIVVDVVLLAMLAAEHVRIER